MSSRTREDHLFESLDDMLPVSEEYRLVDDELWRNHSAQRMLLSLCRISVEIEDIIERTTSRSRIEVIAVLKRVMENVAANLADTQDCDIKIRVDPGNTSNKEIASARKRLVYNRPDLCPLCLGNRRGDKP